MLKNNLSLRTTIALLLVLALHVLGQAQNKTNEYQPLATKGTLPKELITPSSQKYRSEIKKIDKKEKRKTRKQKQTFYLESNFGIDDLLQSGFVLYNDPLGKYVTQVADTLLIKKPELRGKLKFYVVRTSIVNAFATNQGYIFVTMGLLAQLENEAQLAFVLSHEIIHYEKQHALNFYLEASKIDKNTSQNTVMRAANFDRNLLKRTFAKEQETEADSLGLERFLLSRYDHDVIDNVFDVLRYSYLSFDEVKFDKSFFETPHLKFPADYQREKISEIKGESDDKDDSYSTHPNIAKRQAAVDRRLAKVGKRKGKLFLLPEAQFNEVQRIARTELPLLELHNEMYYNAIYDTYILLKENKDTHLDFYYKKCIAKGLYCIAKYRNIGREYDIPVDSLEGEFQGVVHFFEKMKPAEANALAVDYAWRLHKAYPKDSEMKTIAQDALNEMLFYHIKDAKDFATTPLGEFAKADKKIAKAAKDKKDKKELAKEAKAETKTTDKKVVAKVAVKKGTDSKIKKTKAQEEKEKAEEKAAAEKAEAEKIAAEDAEAAEKAAEEEAERVAAEEKAEAEEAEAKTAAEKVAAEAAAKDKKAADKKPKRSDKFSKIEKAKKEEKTKSVVEKSKNDSLIIAKHAFVDWLKDTAFVAQLKRSQTTAGNRQKRKEYYNSDKGKKEYAKTVAKNELNGQRLGIDKVVVINPGYLRLDATKDYKADYLRGEQRQDKLSPIIAENARLAGVQTTILDVNDLKAGDSERFNEIALLNEWFAEQIDFEALTITPGHRQAEIDAIAKKYGTKYFCWSGVVSIHKGTNNIGWLLMFVNPPVGILILSQPNNDTVLYNMVYNVETGEVNTVGYKTYRSVDAKPFLNAHFYDMFLQIKSKSK